MIFNNLTSYRFWVTTVTAVTPCFHVSATAVFSPLSVVHFAHFLRRQNHIFAVRITFSAVRTTFSE